MRPSPLLDTLFSWPPIVPLTLGGTCGKLNALVITVTDLVEALAKQGFYCQIDGCLHPYSERAKKMTAVNLVAASMQLSTWKDDSRKLAMSRLGDITGHWLRMYQSQECADRAVSGKANIPDIVYKYIPRERIGGGALRWTQETGQVAKWESCS